jgi:DNA-binding CsgD family transcriptional regulator
MLLDPEITLRLVEWHLERAPHPALTSILDRLTDREREVLAEVCAGASNAEIGVRLHLSESTVKTYVGQLLAKTGCRDRVHLVVLGIRTGLATP